ncbi:hypothetical protein NUW58_g8574 [Xylaria curta]|uniref:Uncharacterized protein n=1 Tax=Xylaria curta TaxID=42375 RepID=A0ACC1N883_9PEZI|nr:hypothetical protein NUW58_g8574 [Xylaria curta]
MCLLYTNQTALNRAVVLRVLHESVTDLKTTASGNTSLTPQLKLARVHALMFYQTIRMFDGDITLGSEAERDMALLESWNQDLCKVRDNLDDLADKGEAISEHPPESWERILAIGVPLFFVGRSPGKPSSSLDPNGQDPHVGQIITYISHLWNAQNSFDFFQAWREKPLYIISGFSFEDFLKTGTGDDLDDFAIYILTVFFGVNEIKTFCHETSGRILTPI